MVTAVMGFFPSRGSLQRKFLPSHMKERIMLNLTDTAKTHNMYKKCILLCNASCNVYVLYINDSINNSIL